MLEISHDPQAARFPFSSNHGQDIPTTNLGTFSTVKQRAPECQFCAAVVDIIDRNRDSPVGRYLPPDERLSVRADPNQYYGVFTPTSQWGKATYLLRRLCLLVYSKEADDDKHVAHIPYFAQACETGATESEAGPDEQRASISASALVFGGRKRPLVLDVRWIRSWMQICEGEHKEACFLHTDQVKHLQYVS